MSPSKRPPKALIPVVVLVLVAAGVGGWFWWQARTQAGSGASALTGIVEATSYQVSALTSGRVAEVPVAEGDTVRAGDVLARLDDTTLALQVDQADAGLSAAKAAVQQAERDSASSADLAAARARQKQAEAAVSLARTQRDNATVTAPHAGTVSVIATNTGQAAVPGRTLIMLVDTTDPFVRVYLPEPRLGEVRVGQQVTVTSDIDTVARTGTVTSIASDPEFSPNNVVTKDQRVTLVYQVRVRIDDPSGALRAGLPVDVALR